jgi:hypothetical protein
MADTTPKTPHVAPPKTPAPNVVTQLACDCGEKIGHMLTAVAPHSLQVPKVYCLDCGEKMIAKKLEKK